MHTSEIDPDHEFTRLDETLSAFEELRASGEERLNLCAPEVSGWSVGQHLYHAALATDLALRNVRSLVSGKGRLIQTDGELDARAAAVLASDETPRGVSEAPRMVRPGTEIDPEFLAMEQSGNRDALTKLRTIAEDIGNAPGWIPHQDLGPLRAAHWLRFAALHARHHHAIVRDVIGG